MLDCQLTCKKNEKAIIKMLNAEAQTKCETAYKILDYLNPELSRESLFSTNHNMQEVDNEVEEEIEINLCTL